MDEPRTPTGTRRGWWWVVPVVLAALLIGLLFPTEEQLGGFAILGWRPWAIPSAVVLLALAGWLAIRTPVWRVVLAGLLVSLVNRAAMDHLVRASQASGISVEVIAPIQDLLHRHVAAGHGGESRSAVSSSTDSSPV